MADNRITAVAVCNPDGTLLSNLSAKDLKVLHSHVDVMEIGLRETR